MLLKAQEEIKEQRMEVEISVLSEATEWKHRILKRDYLDPVQVQMVKEIEDDDVEMS